VADLTPEEVGASTESYFEAMVRKSGIESLKPMQAVQAHIQEQEAVVSAALGHDVQRYGVRN